MCALTLMLEGLFGSLVENRTHQPRTDGATRSVRISDPWTHHDGSGTSPCSSKSVEPSGLCTKELHGPLIPACWPPLGNTLPWIRLCVNCVVELPASLFGLKVPSQSAQYFIAPPPPCHIHTVVLPVSRIHGVERYNQNQLCRHWFSRGRKKRVSLKNGRFILAQSLEGFYQIPVWMSPLNLLLPL